MMVLAARPGFAFFFYAFIQGKPLPRSFLPAMDGGVWPL
jgi:hypothetical protein